jgi:hypothetical protein
MARGHPKPKQPGASGDTRGSTIGRSRLTAPHSARHVDEIGRFSAAIHPSATCTGASPDRRLTSVHAPRQPGAEVLADD